MEIKIGIQNVAREIALETDATVSDLNEKVAAAMKNSTPLQLEDKKGNITIIPADSIGYIEIGSQENRPVGFGMG